MRNSILSIALFAATCTIATGCAGEPFSSQSGEPEAAANAADAGQPARSTTSARTHAVPIRIEHDMSVAARAPSDVRLAFAAHGVNRLALFDARSGSMLLEQAFEGVVADVDWDATGQRLLVVEQSPEADGSRVHAFEIASGALTRVASSEALAPETRVFALPPRVIALSEDMGTSWSLFDALLNRQGASKALIKPSGFFVARPGHAVALNPYLLDDQGDADEIVDVSFNGTWTVERTRFAAPGRPSSRLAWARYREEAYVVRKHAEFSAIELGEIFAKNPVPPKTFLDFPLQGGTGELEAALIDTSGKHLVALLSRGSAPGALALVPIKSKAPAKVFELGALVEHSAWPSRAIALSDQGELWVATAAGVCGFRVSFEDEAPSLTPIGAEAELLAPIGMLY